MATAPARMKGNGPEMPTSVPVPTARRATRTVVIVREWKMISARAVPMIRTVVSISRTVWVRRSGQQVSRPTRYMLPTDSQSCPAAWAPMAALGM